MKTTICDRCITLPQAAPVPVQDVKAGEFVKRSANTSKVYRRAGYDRASKKFALVDCDDISREVYVKRGTELFIGFTY